MKRFAVCLEKEEEHEISVPFEFLSKAEMAEDYSMSANPDCKT